MSTWTVNSEISLQSFIGDVRELFRVNKYLKLTAKVGKARSLDQNAILHAWIEQIARELREDDALGHKCYIKLHHGVPILRAEDEQFREAYDQVIMPLSYEKKLIAMQCWPVTSIMTKMQLSSLLEVVQDDFQKRGVLLMFPNVQIEGRRAGAESIRMQG